MDNDPCKPSTSSDMCSSSSPLHRIHPLYLNVDELEDKPHIKRPMNSFMVWSIGKRKELAKQNPNMSNANISKHLGEEWKNLPPDTKQLFVDKAYQLREEHKKQFPDYKYFPRKKDSKEGDPSNSLVPTNYLSGHQSGYVNSCIYGAPVSTVWHPRMGLPPPAPIVPCCPNMIHSRCPCAPYYCNNPYHRFM